MIMLRTSHKQKTYLTALYIFIQQFQLGLLNNYEKENSCLYTRDNKLLNKTNNKFLIYGYLFLHIYSCCDQ